MIVVSHSVDVLTDRPCKIGAKVFLKTKGIYEFTEERRFVALKDINYEGSKIVDIETGRCYVYHRGKFVSLAELIVESKSVKPRIFFNGGEVVVVDGFGHVCVE